MRFLMILHHKINLRYILSFHPRNEGPCCLKSACGHIQHRNIQKVHEQHFLKKQSFRKYHFNTTWGVRWTLTLIFLAEGHRKTKSNR